MKYIPLVFKCAINHEGQIEKEGKSLPHVKFDSLSDSFSSKETDSRVIKTCAIVNSPSTIQVK